MKQYKRILCVSDLHFPYCHKDTFKFLKALKKKYKPDKIVLLGDELDYHALSFHNADPDLDSTGKELEKALGYMESIYKIFPRADVLESNHGSMVYRKAKHNGTPRHLLKGYKEVLDAPQGWNWHTELVLKMSNGEKVFFTHGKGANTLAMSKNVGMSYVQGHFHSKLEIQYWAMGHKYHFGMTVGCMIDNNSLAFAYNKLFPKLPIMSHAIIEDGVPKPLPMFQTKSGRWNGQTP